MAKYVVATLGEIPPGDRKIVDVAGRSIGIFNLDGEFFALRNRCPHQAGPLCAGRLSGLLESSVPGEYGYSRPGEMLRCPWHGWEFDVRTGQSWFDPEQTKVRRYKVSVADENALGEDAQGKEAATTTSGLQEGPYVAETYPVSVEQQYIVVEVK